MASRLDVESALDRAAFVDALGCSPSSTGDHVSASTGIKLPVPADVAATAFSNRNCGECLWNNVEVVRLGRDGICPKCGANYGAER